MRDGGAVPVSSQVDKKVIKNGNLNLKVDKIDEAVNEIEKIAKDNQGEIASSNIRQSTRNIKNGSMVVRVPVTNFEKTFSEIKTKASLVLNESTSGKDVTEEYSDLQAQLKNKKAEEESFIKILDRAGEIADVLAVTREVSRVRGEIERLQGRIKYLSSQTDMSTISVSLSEDQEVTIVNSWRPGQEVKESFNALVKNVQEGINFIIRFLIVVIPILAVWAIIIWVIYIIGKRIYLKIKK